MYAALNKKGTLVYAKDALENQIYYCCRCKDKVKLIATAARKYFRHLNQKDNEVNERPVHKLGKSLLFSSLQKLPLKKLELEVYLPKIKQRPDILVDRQIALEYQCAKINIKVLAERIAGYRSIGMTSYWILGDDYLAASIRHEYLKFIDFNEKWGFYILMLDAKRGHLSLFHHIKFLGPFNKIYFELKVFSKEEFNQIFDFQPQYYQIEAQAMNLYLIEKLRRKNDSRSQKLKMTFYQQHQLTVEDYLSKRSFPPIKPIYEYPAWQMVCGQTKKTLSQPLLNYVKEK